MANSGWEFWIDRGGTFTDIVARDPGGALHARKLLSVNPGRYDDAGLAAIREFLGLTPADPIPAEALDAVKVGTTVATNALLERRGARLALAVTRGFRDQFLIGYQNRPDLFALNIRRARPLYEHVVEIDERISARGELVRALDEDGARRTLQAAREAGCDALAIAFMHSTRNDAHERACATIAREIGFDCVVTSAKASPRPKYVVRGWTAIADAYVTPPLRAYADGLAAALDPEAKGRLKFMRSDGGLTDAAHFSGKSALLSGPAGGVVGFARTGEAAGFRKLIGFDMGGTSTDVSRYDGAFERRQESPVLDWRIAAPALEIHTVAAGGGSILAYADGRAQVGPESAGADPGPACYGRGGPLAVTDANLILGKIQPKYFPSAFGPNADQPLDAEAARAKFAELSARMNMAPEKAAEGFIKVAAANMAEAIKTISVARGYDVREYVLNCFGGAGGQHACVVADLLGVETVLINPFAGVLSALGIGLAETRAIRQQTIDEDFDPRWCDADNPQFAVLEQAAREELLAQNAEPSRIRAIRRLYLRTAGSDAEIAIPAQDHDAALAEFADRHMRQFGYLDPDRAVRLAAIEVEMIAPSSDYPRHDRPARDGGALEPMGEARCFMAGAWRQAPVYGLDRLRAQDAVRGPALIIEPNTTIVIEPDWRAEMRGDGNLVLKRVHRAAKAAQGDIPDPAQLEVFNKAFASIAEQMGAALERTAVSVNIKERLDFSCAVFDGSGGLVSNAPHMPVHLGSMGAAVKEIIERNEHFEPGDAFAANDPYHGGTHLPDVTVIAPVFIDGAERPRFFVAARGHHADIGGVAPGSMPALSRDIREEGVLIDNFKLVEAGRFREDALRALLASGDWPARNPDQNLADLRAQLAACAKGAAELEKLCANHGAMTVAQFMDLMQANAERSVRRAIRKLNNASFEAPLDTGETIRVALEIDGEAGAAIVDFAGTSPQSETNFNAPSAIARAAVLYVFRCITGDDIPLNDGCLRPIEIRIPENSLLDPSFPAAVAAGNVETSQTIADCLLGATGALAACQGTMNNLTFGDETRQYYETLCGGAGAGPEFDGADAVHSHMTNSRLTDPEVLERRLPVRLERFEIRRGSGGRGRHRGGDGVIRELTFLEPASVSLLAQRRLTAPFGLKGGGPGAPGRCVLHRAGGGERVFGPSDCAEAQAGDRITIETPGGGGFGASESD